LKTPVLGNWRVNINRVWLTVMCLALLGCATTTFNESALIDQGMANRPLTVPELAQMIRAAKPDPTVIAKNEALTKIEPSTDLNNEQRGHFYIKRALAFRGLGKMAQSINDLNAALESFGSNLSDNRQITQNLLITSYAAVGDFTQSQAVFHRIRNERPDIAWVISREAQSAAITGSFRDAHMGLLRLKNMWAGTSHSDSYYVLERATHYHRTAAAISRAEGDIQAAIHHTRGIISTYKPLLTILLSGSQSVDQARINSHRTGLLGVRLELAQLLLLSGDVREAEFESTSVLKESISGSAEVADGGTHASLVLALCLQSRGKISEAALIYEEAKASAKRFALNGESKFGAYESELSIEFSLAEGDVRKASYLAEKALKTDAVDGLGFARISRREKWVQALLQTHQYAEVLSLLSPSLQRLEATNKQLTPEYGRLLAYQALARVMRDGSENNWHDLNSAMLRVIQETVELRAIQSSLGSTALRVKFLAEAYLAAMELSKRSDASLTREVADLAKLVSGRDTALSMSTSARLANTDSQTTELLRRMQDLQLQSNNLLEIAIRADVNSDMASQSIARDARERSIQAGAARLAIAQKLPSSNPELLRLIGGKPPTTSDLQRTLRPNEVYLSTYTSVDKTYVWLVQANKPPLWYSVAIGSAEMANLVTTLRNTLDASQWLTASPPPFDIATLKGLFEKLLSPGNAVLATTDKLIVNAHGVLASLPFSLLVSPETHAIVHTSSAASFVSARARSSDIALTKNTFVGFGNPQFSQTEQNLRELPTEQLALRKLVSLRTGVQTKLTDLPALPDTELEISTLATLLGPSNASNTYLRYRATKANVLSGSIENADYIAFATHSLQANDIDGLYEPALALSFSEKGLHHSVLKASDIARLKIQAQWVVLSACSTADFDESSVQGGSGIASAFLYAGAKALLVTQWPVDSLSARDLMIDTFAAYRQSGNGDKAKSLQIAMQKMMRDPVRSHPFYWAAFSVIGD
jgi:CHAT domain-containing protein